VSRLDDRDAALLALGFAGVLRRSELVGLDWQQQGSGDGVVTRDERGIVLTLLRTKGGKGEPETVIVPCQDIPTACEALERWAKTSNLLPGEPVFRAIDKGQHVAAERLTDRSVARIIKARVRARTLVNGASEADADALADLCGGLQLASGILHGRGLGRDAGMEDPAPQPASHRGAGGALCPGCRAVDG
jgi:hypothetical protein